MTARARFVSMALLAMLVLGASACGSGKREAASLVAAVDRYRRAPMESKAAPAALLEQVACSDSEVCAAKTACLQSAQPTVRGIRLKDEVNDTLDQLNQGRITREQAAELDLSRKLDDASRAIEDGRKNLAKCDAKVISLRIKYAL
jgi:predicted outer membrane protein